MLPLLIFSAIYLLLISSVIRSNGMRTLLSMVLVFAAFLTLSPYLVLVGIGCTVWMLVCTMGGIPNRATLAGALVVVAAVVSLDSWAVYQTVAKVARGRQQYPFVSLVDRLAYEQRAVASSEELLKSYDEAKLSAEQAEFDSSGYMRTRALKVLHNRSLFSFVAADGFGSFRMPAVEREPMFYLKQNPSAQPIPQPEMDESFDLATPDGGWQREPRIFEQETLRTAHVANSQAFAAPISFGFVKSLDQVAGFQPHGLFENRDTFLWDGRPPQPAIKDLPGLRLLRLELVSMLKFDTPQVYVSAHLPTMEHPDDFQTRPLDDFEGPAMERLKAGEDMVQAKYRGHLRMLGALRAGKSCVECHKVPHNTLLGAFTYRFKNDFSDPEPKDTKPEPATF